MRDRHAATALGLIAGIALVIVAATRDQFDGINVALAAVALAAALYLHTTENTATERTTR